MIRILLFSSIFFFLLGFSFTDTGESQDSRERGGDHFLFHSTTSTTSRIFRHLFATLHVRWLSHVFNCTACIYQTATQWDLPPYRITIWLIDDVMIMIMIINHWLCRFLSHQFDTVNRWTRTRIDYHPCITYKWTD